MAGADSEIRAQARIRTSILRSIVLQRSAAFLHCKHKHTPLSNSSNSIMSTRANSVPHPTLVKVRPRERSSKIRSSRYRLGPGRSIRVRIDRVLLSRNRVLTSHARHLSPADQQKVSIRALLLSSALLFTPPAHRASTTAGSECCFPFSPHRCAHGPGNCILAPTSPQSRP